MQKDSRLKRIKTKADSAEEFIQFRLYKIRDDDQIDDSKATGLKFYSNQLERIGASGSYINSREVTKRFRLEPGYYLIIPSTYEDDKSCEFMVRILTEEAIEAKLDFDHFSSVYNLNFLNFLIFIKFVRPGQRGSGIFKFIF